MKHLKSLSTVLGLGVLLLLQTACTHRTPQDVVTSLEPARTEYILSPGEENNTSHLIRASYSAVDAVLSAIENSRLSFRLNPTRPLIVTSFVDVDDVRYSSTFGRMIGEQVGSRFAQSGYNVIELKMRNDIYVPHPDRGRSAGEFMLSREIQELSFEHDAQAVIVGTYAAAKNIVYVTLKVVDVRDNMIVYSTDYSLPIDDDTKKLLRDNRRRPVRL